MYVYIAYTWIHFRYLQIRPAVVKFPTYKNLQVDITTCLVSSLLKVMLPTNGKSTILRIYTVIFFGGVLF
jgi:hypothetical protein